MDALCPACAAGKEAIAACYRGPGQAWRTKSLCWVEGPHRPPCSGPCLLLRRALSFSPQQHCFLSVCQAATSAPHNPPLSDSRRVQPKGTREQGAVPRSLEDAPSVDCFGFVWRRFCLPTYGRSLLGRWSRAARAAQLQRAPSRRVRTRPTIPLRVSLSPIDQPGHNLPGKPCIVFSHFHLSHFPNDGVDDEPTGKRSDSRALFWFCGSGRRRGCCAWRVRLSAFGRARCCHKQRQPRSMAWQLDISKHVRGSGRGRCHFSESCFD